MRDTDEQQERRILALVADLIFAARVRGAAASGVEVHTSSRAEALKREAEVAVPDVVLVDLGAADDPLGFIRWIRGRESLASARVVAFGSHVDADRLNAARAAGADTVLARSAFVRQLPELLSG